MNMPFTPHIVEDRESYDRSIMLAKIASIYRVVQLIFALQMSKEGEYVEALVQHQWTQGRIPTAQSKPLLSHLERALDEQ